MKEKIKKFAEMCAESRFKSLTKSGQKKKKELLEFLIEDGTMYTDENGSNKFKHVTDSIFFSETITEWEKSREEVE